MNKLIQLLNELAAVYPYNEKIQLARTLAVAEDSFYRNKFVFSGEQLLEYTKKVQISGLNSFKAKVDPRIHAAIDQEVKGIERFGESNV